VPLGLGCVVAGNFRRKSFKRPIQTPGRSRGLYGAPVSAAGIQSHLSGTGSRAALGIQTPAWISASIGDERLGLKLLRERR